jgi:hypothetical protein
MFQFWCCESTLRANAEVEEIYSMKAEIDKSDYAKPPFWRCSTSSSIPPPSMSFRAAPVLVKKDFDCTEAESTVIAEEALPSFPRLGIASARKQGSNESLDEKSTEAGSESPKCTSDTECETSLRVRRGLGELSCETDARKSLLQVEEAAKVANFRSKSNSSSNFPIHHRSPSTDSRSTTASQQSKHHRSIRSRRGVKSKESSGVHWRQ